MNSQSTLEFLRSIDPDLVQYNYILVNKGFSSVQVPKHLVFSDISEIPVGHHHLLINEVSKICSPHSKALLTGLDASNFQEGSKTPLQSLQP